MRTITHQVRLSDPIIGRGNKPFGSPSQPPFLEHDQSSPGLFYFAIARPRHPLYPLPLSFPPLIQFDLTGDAVYSWISLFERLAAGVPGVQCIPPLTRIRESLKDLNVGNFPNPIIDVSFVSPIQRFHNLASLNVVAGCCDENGDNRCAFELNDDDVAKLAVALPRLTFLRLGSPCSGNTCATTIACLLWISVHCLELESLEIHFNTANIVEDFKRVSTDLQFERLRSLPRCPLPRLEVWRAPLTLDEPGLEIVANGMVDTFPLLGCCKGLEGMWEDLSERIEELQKLTYCWWVRS